MRVMCLNAWGGTLHAPLFAYLATESPDVVCLQEVVHTPASSQDTLIYRDGDHVLSQRANLFREVAALLPDHVAIFCPAAQGVLWDEDRAVASQWGLATFVHRALPIVAQAQGFVYKTFSPHGYGEHPRSRSAHAVRVYDFERGRPLCIAHMHGLRDLAGKADSADRLSQAGRLADLCRQVMETGDPLIVCGDFNVEPDSATFDVMAGLGLRELVTSGGHPGTRTSHYAKAGRYADYMLVNDAVEVIAFEVVREPEVSDHCPLVLTL